MISVELRLLGETNDGGVMYIAEHPHCRPTLVYVDNTTASFSFRGQEHTVADLDEAVLRINALNRILG